MFHELPSRDREDERATGQPQGVGSEAYFERYVAGSDTRGRAEGRSYPRSKQAIHETSGLDSLSNWRIIIAADRIFTP